MKAPARIWYEGIFGLSGYEGLKISFTGGTEHDFLSCLVCVLLCGFEPCGIVFHRPTDRARQWVEADAQAECIGSPQAVGRAAQSQACPWAPLLDSR